MTSQSKRKRNDLTVPLSDMGKLPPQSIDLEEACLGAMLLEKEAIENVIGILSPECFYKEQNGRIYESIVRLYRRSEAIDLLTVCNELKSTSELELVGGSYYVSALTNRIASSANIEFHARIVVQKYLAREMIRVSTDNIKRAFDDTEDVFDIYSNGIGKMEAALNNVMKYEAAKISTIHNDLIYDGIRIAESGVLPGVPSHYRRLDNVTNGWQQQDLIILAGRPGMGKTAAAVCFAINPALKSGKPVAVFSLEMSSKQLVGRIQSNLSGVSASKIIKKQLNKDEIAFIDGKCGELHKAPLFIDDTPGITLLELKSKARRLVAKHGVEMIVIDYLQLMHSGYGKENREQEISTISRGLKNLAKELNIPIIALSQLSRAVEGRADKKPQLSDLRESGAIEQDADMVIFTYRPEYYDGVESYETEKGILPVAGLMVLIIGKHRNGGLGEVHLGFVGEQIMITDYDFENQCPMHRPTNTVNNQTNNVDSLVVKQENCTFVQETNEAGSINGKLGENTDFLNQKDKDNEGTGF